MDDLLDGLITMLVSAIPFIAITLLIGMVLVLFVGGVQRSYYQDDLTVACAQGDEKACTELGIRGWDRRKSN